MMFVYALEDLEEGAELTTPYTSFTHSFAKRSDQLTKKWGFTCDCRLCELDGRLGKAKRVQLEKLEDKFEEIKFVFHILLRFKTEIEPFDPKNSKINFNLRKFRPKFMSSPNPEHWIRPVKALVEQMRTIYGPGRPQFRTCLSRPLSALGMLHNKCYQDGAAVPLLEEVVSTCITAPLSHMSSPSTHMLLAIQYQLNLNNGNMAKKVGLF
jgi:hypothetical protein